MKKQFLISVLSLFSLAGCVSHTSAPITDRMYQVDISQVKVGGEIGQRVEMTVNNNLLVLNTDSDFLKPFQERNKTGGFIGLGMLIDATVRFAYTTGDARVVKLKQHIITETIKTQQPDGYIGMLKPEARIWGLWDVHEMGYIIYGLSMDYRYFKEKKSLESAGKLADYMISRWKAEPEHAFGNGGLSTDLITTGLDFNMLALYQQTRDIKYLEFVRDFRKLKELNPKIVLGRWGLVDGHAYSQISRCLAQLRLNDIEPDPHLLKQSKDVLDFLINKNGLVVTGECGDLECWHNTQEGTINLGETCATAYLLRFLDEVMRKEGNPLYGDLMERIIFNGLFAAQSPDGRKLRYYTAFDGPRNYFGTDTYCCPNNFRRIISELPGMIYYLQDKGITVNLYTASSAKVELADKITLDIKQETDYPTSGHIVIILNPSESAEFSVRLRIPLWSKEHSVKINGETIHKKISSDDFLVLKRHWKANDKIELNLPMPPRFVKGRVSQSGRVALMHGPILYCLDRKHHPELEGIDLRNLVYDPSTVEGPFNDDSVRSGGTAFKIKAWKPGAWYPQTKCNFTLTLTEFPDPDGEAIYFKVPNPDDPKFVDDELISGNTPPAK